MDHGHLYYLGMFGSKAVAAVVLALTLLATACGSATTDTSAGADAGLHVGTVRPAVTPPTTTAAPVVAPEPPPTTTAPPVETVPPDPYETVVATVLDSVKVLHTFEQPDGEPVYFEYALTNPTYYENDLVLMVTDVSEDDRWLKVQVPVRPNGTEAWIRSADVTLSTHRYRALIDVTERSVTVWSGEDIVAETVAVVGKERSPTPVGSFYVNELITKWDGSAYGPYILSLSGFSEALETFNGGVPVIAIHGTNRPELMGGAHSNGCIRIPNEVITVLAETVPMGTPVDIVA